MFSSQVARASRDLRSREPLPQSIETLLGAKPPGDINAVPEHAFYIAGDITSESDVTKAVAGTKPQVIIHSAGTVGNLNLRYLCEKGSEANMECERHLGSHIGGNFSSRPV